MGRKAKKRVKGNQVVSPEMERLAESEGHIDIIGDHEEHILGMYIIFTPAAHMVTLVK